MTNQLSSIDPAWAWAPYEPDEKRPFDRAAAAHLFRRGGFCATSDELDAAVRRGLPATVELLVRPPAGAESFERDMRTFGAALLAGGDVQALPPWWLYRMLHTPDPALEKLTLFWHGHFATSAEKVDDTALMIQQNSLLRRHARGKLGPLVQDISRDPAMLLYLDSAANRKVRPNENYARELMELFCLGPGNYTEQDIKELARCFTGWELRRDRFRFNGFEHDDGVKSLLGSRGAFSGEEAVEIVLDQAAAPRFIAGKLARFYVLDEPPLPPELIEPLAADLRESDFDTSSLLRRILGSNLFFSEHAVGRKVRSPVDLAVGLLRTFEGATDLRRLSQDLAELGHQPFFPPNVKGWDGGRTWINSSTLLGRANLIRRLAGGGTEFAGGSLQDYLDGRAPKPAAARVDWLTELLIAVPLAAPVRDNLVSLARAKPAGDLLHAIGALPEFQLS